MKKILSAVVLGMLAACGSAPSGSDATRNASNGSLETYFEQTPRGVPWVVGSSIAVKRGRAPENKYDAAQSALKIWSHKRKPPYIVPVSVNGATAKFRVVTLDGHNFGVVNNLSIRGFYSGKAIRRVQADYIAKAQSLSGCGYGGSTLVSSGRYGNVDGYVVYLNC
ncbi:hypothetical protein N9M66_01020 [Litoreibacter sp.]|nr:hypothetical protein [Litoreibacter sp.]